MITDFIRHFQNIFVFSTFHLFVLVFITFQMVIFNKIYKWKELSRIFKMSDSNEVATHEPLILIFGTLNFVE